MKKFSLTSSKRRTPWDDYDVLSASEEFVKKTYLDVYNRRHRSLAESNENLLLNSFQVFECRYCQCEDIIKYGHTKNGVIRYFCKKCHKTFTITTGTIFENHKISITEWVEQLLQIISYESSSLMSKNGRNSYTTTKYWNAKIFKILHSYQENIILSGKVQIDETYFSVSKKNMQVTSENKMYRGLSRNKMCIGIGSDGNQTIAIYEDHTGKPNIHDTWKTFGNHIAKGSTLIHDSERSHSILITNLELNEEKYNSKELAKLEDKDNPLRTINHSCALLKKFLKGHSGFDRDEIQGYLDLFAFLMNPPAEPLEKVKILLVCSLYIPETLKYRDYYINKTHK